MAISRQEKNRREREARSPKVRERDRLRRQKERLETQGSTEWLNWLREVLDKDPIPNT